MFGLAGFRVLGVVEVDGELEVTVETEQTVVGCDGCGVLAQSQGRRAVLLRDTDVFARRARLRWQATVGEAVVALRRARVRPADVDRDAPGGRGRAALTERGPRPGVPSGRP